MYNIAMAVVLLVVLLALTGFALALAQTRAHPTARGPRAPRGAATLSMTSRLWWPEIEPPVPRADATPRPNTYCLITA